MMSRQTNKERECKMEFGMMVLVLLAVLLIVFNVVGLAGMFRIYNAIVENEKKDCCNCEQQCENDTVMLQSFDEVENVVLKQTIENASDLQEQNIHNDENSIRKEVLLPSIPTNVKSFTDYRVYNIEGTPHYRFQNQCYTDQMGLRRFGEDYCVAVGSYYSSDIGDRFEVTLDTGFTFTAIVSDTKADYDTDEKHMYTPCVNYNGEDSGNLLEFIVDVESISKEMYAYGSVDYHSQFKGNIVSMFYLGRDQSGDWTSYE